MLRTSLLLQAVRLAGDTGGFAHHQGLLWWIRFKQLQNCAKISDDRGEGKIIGDYGFLVSFSIANNKNNTTEGSPWHFLYLG